jgi:hypothetical protein
MSRAREQYRASENGAGTRYDEDGTRVPAELTINSVPNLKPHERIVRVAHRDDAEGTRYTLELANGQVIAGVKAAHLFDPRKMDPLLTQAAPDSDIP